MAVKKYTSHKIDLKSLEVIKGIVEKEILNKYPNAQGKLIFEIMPTKINLQKSITIGHLDEQLAAKIRTEYPQHIVEGT